MRLWRTKPASAPTAASLPAAGPTTANLVLDAVYDDADFDSESLVPEQAGGSHAALVTTEDRRNIKWTADEERLLVGAHRDRQPVEAIAARLGRTRGAVVSRMHRLAGFTCPQLGEDHEPGRVGASWTPSDDTALVAGWREGKNTADLALLLDRSQKGVQIRLVLLHEVSLGPTASQ